jgi:hypothetical protein
MTISVPQAPLPKYTRHDDVPEVFADGVRNVNFLNGLVYLELTKTQIDSQSLTAPALEQHTTARVILGPAAVLQLHQGLNAIATAIQQQAAQLSVPPQVPPAPVKPN